MGKVLIVYYSRRGENYWNGAIKNLSKGNTEIVAEMIARLTGGDLFQVDTAQPYAADYHACVDEARTEFRQGARPELKEYLDSVEGYDTVFVGYPNWCGTMPMAMFTFLESFDLSGKTIAPFCTNEGSGMGRSEADIRRLCPGAELAKGLSVRGSAVGEAGPEIRAWLEKNRLL